MAKWFVILSVFILVAVAIANAQGYGGGGGGGGNGNNGGGAGNGNGNGAIARSGAMCRTAGAWGRNSAGNSCVCARPQRAKRHRFNSGTRLFWHCNLGNGNGNGNGGNGGGSGGSGGGNGGIVIIEP